VYYVRTLSITLGLILLHPPSRLTSRPGRKVANAGSDDVDVDLGGSKSVSRRHARIAYDFEIRKFKLSLLGKNGVTINGIHHLPHEPSIELSSRCLTCMHVEHSSS
jgi:hypothetical protein